MKSDSLINVLFSNEHSVLFSQTAALLQLPSVIFEIYKDSKLEMPNLISHNGDVYLNDASSPEKSFKFL